MVVGRVIDDSPLRPAPVWWSGAAQEGRVALVALRAQVPQIRRQGGERRWRHRDFGRYGVELMGLAPRVACAEHGVVVAQVPWAEPGSRFTKFEMERAWLTAVASRKTGRIPTHRVEDRR